ncbi:putative BTB/POZ domain containing protein [Lyophyllum shimeji]|uniref:BTB/POZ domain containing protein n=1 Tax=Lyophyllum shimeji TaxID=47721 RepID=A0A9P3UJU6_LYOSH|nr:putative BTB/POZ domain containing protein [Lyophyllum shimeji]
MVPNTTNDQEFKQLQRHSHYYINGGDVQFLVEKILFRVHRYFFERESPVFREQIELPSSPPTSPGRPQQGEEESVAISLDVSAVHFEKLLGVFYNPRYTLYDWTTEDWTSVLELAHKWQFDEVKKLAIRELEKLTIPLLPRILLYQRFEIDHALLVPLYADLCSRSEALDEGEATALGIKTTVLIFSARERLRAQPSDGGRSPLPAGLEKEDVHNAIRSLLGLTARVTSPTGNQNGSSGNDSRGDRGGQSPTRGLAKNANGRTGRHVGPAKK